VCEINEETFDDVDANTMDDELGSEDEFVDDIGGDESEEHN
jgi:hypothetical protein